MNNIKFKVEQLENAKSEFDVIMDILAENAAELDNLIMDMEDYSSIAVKKLILQLDQFKDMHSQMLEDMEIAQREIIEIEIEGISILKPINYNQVLNLKTPEVISALKGIGRVLDENLSAGSLSPSSEFITWINARDNELSDGFVEAALDIFDEFEQREVEEIYRSNKKVYEAAYENFVEDMTFKAEIDYIEGVIKQLKGFSKDDFPQIAEGNLYENLFEGAVEVSYKDLSKTVKSKYNTDTNGILPYTIIGWVAVVAAVAATVFIVEAGVVGTVVSGIVSAGTIVAESIAGYVTAGYQWLVTSSIYLKVISDIKIQNTINSVYGKLVSANVWWNGTALPWLCSQINKPFDKYAYDYIGKNVYRAGEKWKTLFTEFKLVGSGQLALESVSLPPLYLSAKIIDTSFGSPSMIKELSGDLANDQYIEVLTDLIIGAYAPIPFLQIDDNYIDKYEDNLKINIIDYLEREDI